jgi:5'-methylthioadenosine phosphorylase
MRPKGARLIGVGAGLGTYLAILKAPKNAIAISTDYDCWKEDESADAWEQIVKLFYENGSNAKQMLIDVIGRMG